MSKKRAVTMDDIAEWANVSKPTVSRALSDSPLVNAKTREHVLEVARKHGYAVNRHAQKLRHNRTNTIGVSIDFLSHRRNHITDPFMFDLLAGVSEALGDRNQDLLLTAPNHNDLDAFQQILLSRGVDGFIFLGQGHRESMIEECARSGAPMVVWGARRKRTPYCVVGSDNFLGGQLAGRYFLDNGRNNFLFVGDVSHSEIQLRLQGLQAIAEDSGSTVNIRHVSLQNFAYASTLEAINDYLDSISTPPDAVFACSDSAAMACIRSLSERGLRVPADVSVVGYNDIPSAGYFHPPITTIRQDTYQAGALLVDKLMKIIDGKRPRSETINTELIIRDT